MSLDALLSNATQPSYHKYTYSDGFTTTQLIRYCQRFVSLLNARPLDRTLVADEPSDSFIALIDNLPVASTLQEHFNNLSAVYKAFPDVSVDLVDISCVMDDQTRGRASALMLLEIRGYPKTLVRQVMAVLHFRRGEDGWRCFQYVGMRGQIF